MFIANAGLVLLGPYLPRVFGSLDLLSEQGFSDKSAARRAALLMQYAVTGSAVEPETQLPSLNNLLCGLPPSTPLMQETEFLPHELDAVEGLLKAMIAHWSALGETSIAGLRQTFLQREGQLVHGSSGWQLQVTPGSFDMLLDRLPWGYSTLQFPWMREVLQVQWR